MTWASRRWRTLPKKTQAEARELARSMYLAQNHGAEDLPMHRRWRYTLREIAAALRGMYGTNIGHTTIWRWAQAGLWDKHRDNFRWFEWQERLRSVERKKYREEAEWWTL